MADFGKRSQRGVPHKGWSCVGEEDLGHRDETCQMCDRQQIRYVHLMEHPDYPDTLRCGSECASRMEEDRSAAYERERRMSNAAQRRNNFPERKSWKTSSKGNPYIDLDGFHVTIFRRNGLYGAAISKEPVLNGHFLQRRFDNETDAKLAAFDEVMCLKEASD